MSTRTRGWTWSVVALVVGIVIAGSLGFWQMYGEKRQGGR